MATRSRNQRRAYGRWLRKKFGLTLKLMRSADSPSVVGSWLAKIAGKETFLGTKALLLPPKHIRLQELADAGFNCPESRFWLRGRLDIQELAEFFDKHHRISLRNFTEETVGEETPKLPVAYDQSDWGSIVEFCRRHNRAYHTLVNRALPLGDSALAGNIILDAKRYFVCYFEGYGTPRDVDDKVSELRVYMRQFGSKGPQWIPELDILAEDLGAFHPELRPLTVEFSLYPYPVGIQNTSVIFWEWRSGSYYDLSTILMNLLEHADSHDLKMTFPSGG